MYGDVVTYLREEKENVLARNRRSLFTTCETIERIEHILKSSPVIGIQVARALRSTIALLRQNKERVRASMEHLMAHWDEYEAFDQAMRVANDRPSVDRDRAWYKPAAGR